jgi:glycosyltransferase involved in cell wall biosynthesis
MKQAGILAIYLEPTPYILGLLRCLEHRLPGQLEVLFAGRELSQRWSLPEEAYKAVPAYTFLDQVGFLATLRLLWCKLVPQRYALVHLAGWSGHPVLLLALLLARTRGIRVSVESDTPLPPEQALWRHFLKRALFPLLFRLPTFFLPGGSRQMAYLQHYGVAVERIKIACMTVDINIIIHYGLERGRVAREIFRESLGIAVGDCVFLYVGRLEPHKGLYDLVEAYSQLQKEQAGTVLLVVGEGSLDAYMRTKQTSNPMFKITGRLVGEVLLDAYLAADVFVLPSHFEPWGLVINEAMAAGLPVIVSERVGCSDDLVEVGISGLVVPAERPDLLKDAMRKLASNPELRATMAARAKKIIANWTLENTADIMISCWNGGVTEP